MGKHKEAPSAEIAPRLNWSKLFPAFLSSMLQKNMTFE